MRARGEHRRYVVTREASPRGSRSGLLTALLTEPLCSASKNRIRNKNGVPAKGIEPPTRGLKVRSSTTELRRLRVPARGCGRLTNILVGPKSLLPPGRSIRGQRPSQWPNAIRCVRRGQEPDASPACRTTGWASIDRNFRQRDCAKRLVWRKLAWGVVAGG